MAQQATQNANTNTDKKPSFLENREQTGKEVVNFVTAKLGKLFNIGVGLAADAVKGVFYDLPKLLKEKWDIHRAAIFAKDVRSSGREAGKIAREVVDSDLPLEVKTRHTGLLSKLSSALIEPFNRVDRASKKDDQLESPLTFAQRKNLWSEALAAQKGITGFSRSIFEIEKSINGLKANPEIKVALSGAVATLSAGLKDKFEALRIELGKAAEGANGKIDIDKFLAAKPGSALSTTLRDFDKALAPVHALIKAVNEVNAQLEKKPALGRAGNSLTEEQVKAIEKGKGELVLAFIQNKLVPALSDLKVTPAENVELTKHIAQIPAELKTQVAGFIAEQVEKAQKYNKRQAAEGQLAEIEKRLKEAAERQLANARRKLGLDTETA